MAVVHLDHVTVRSYDSSFTRRHNGASAIIFNNYNNNYDVVLSFHTYVVLKSNFLGYRTEQPTASILTYKTVLHNTGWVDWVQARLKKRFAVVLPNNFGISCDNSLAEQSVC